MQILPGVERGLAEPRHGADALPQDAQAVDEGEHDAGVDGGDVEGALAQQEVVAAAPLGDLAHDAQAFARDRDLLDCGIGQDRRRSPARCRAAPPRPRRSRRAGGSRRAGPSARGRRRGKSLRQREELGAGRAREHGEAAGDRDRLEAGDGQPELGQAADRHGVGDQRDVDCARRRRVPSRTGKPSWPWVRRASSNKGRQPSRRPPAHGEDAAPLAPGDESEESSAGSDDGSTEKDRHRPSQIGERTAGPRPRLTPSIPLRLRPGHGELVAAPHELVAVEGEPQRRDDVEHHHRDELRAVAQEHGEIGGRAQQEQHQRRQRMEGMDIAALDRAERPFVAEHHHVDRHEGVAEQARQDREGDDLVERRAEGEDQRDRDEEDDRAVGRAVFRMHGAEPGRQVAVAAHREPGARGVVDAAVGGGERREDRADEEEHHQEGRCRSGGRRRTAA